MVAVDATECDPEMDYSTDVLTGARLKKDDRNVAFSYVRHATEFSRMSPEEIAVVSQFVV